MDERQNRDDIIRRVIDQKQQDKRGELTSTERREVEEYVKREVMPQAYEQR